VCVVAASLGILTARFYVLRPAPSVVDVGLWVAAWGMQSFLVVYEPLVMYTFHPGEAGSLPSSL